MTTKINKALSLGKTQGARKLLEEFYLAENRRQWLEAKQADYDVLYPAYTEEVFSVVFDDMHFEIDEWKQERSDVLIIKEDYETNTVEYKIPIDYEDAPTFEDYKNETRVISEATYDEEGNQLTEEVTELVRPYVKPSNIDELVENYIASKYAELRKIEYPDLGEQLDMVYKDMTTGTNNWLETIRQIKEKYPKDLQ